MQFLDNKINIFLATIFGSLTMSIVVKIDSYEHNQLVNLNDLNLQLVLNPSSYKKLNLSEGSWFNYFQNYNAFSKKITNIKTSEDKYILTLLGNANISPITNIFYKLERKSLLSEIFGF